MNFSKTMKTFGFQEKLLWFFWAQKSKGFFGVKQVFENTEHFASQNLCLLNFLVKN